MTYSTATFDTLKFTRKLKDAGVPEAQAEAEAEAIRDAFSETLDTQVATKTDIIKLDAKIDAVEKNLDTKIDAVDNKLTAKINLVHWMVGFNLVISMGILLKLL